MRVVLVSRDGGPANLVSEAEIVFDDPSPLAGMKLVGFCIWRGQDAELYVTFPSRAFGAGPERKYFDYLRSVDGNATTVKAVKSWVVSEYRRADFRGEPAPPPPPEPTPPERPARRRRKEGRP